MVDAYKKDIEEIYKELDSSKKGLSSNKVRSLIKINGKNELIEKDKKTKLDIFVDQFKVGLGVRWNNRQARR